MSTIHLHHPRRGVIKYQQYCLVSSEDRQQPGVKLETLHKRSLMKIEVSKWVSMLVASVLIAVLLGYINSDLLGEDALIVYLVDMSTRLCVALLFLFMLCTFPWRVYVNVRKNRTLHPEDKSTHHLRYEHTLMIVSLVTFAFTPSLSVPGVAEQINLLVQSEVESNHTLINFIDRYYSLVGAPEVKIVDAIMFSIMLCGFFSFSVLLMKEYSTVPAAKPSLADDHESVDEVHREMRQEEGELETDDLEFGIAQRKQEVVSKCILQGLNSLKETRVLFFVLVAVYFVVRVTFTIVFHMNLSYVPLVGIITVLRVCTFNGDGTYDHVCNLPIQEENCAVGSIGFQRASAILAVTVIEFVLVVQLYRIAVSSSKDLHKIPVKSQRFKHLGFRFYTLQMKFFIPCILIVSTVMVSVLHVNWWVLQPCTLCTEQLDEMDNCTALCTHCPEFYPSSLSVVGVNPLMVGFSSVVLLFGMYSFLLALVYLPPKSSGFKGWFCDSEDHIASVDEQALEDPAYVACEAHVPHSDLTVSHETSTNSDLRATFLKQISTRAMSVTGSKETPHVRSQQYMMYLKTPIGAQINRNLFVMETDVYLYCFTHIAYDVSSLFKLREYVDPELVPPSEYTFASEIADQQYDSSAKPSMTSKSRPPNEALPVEECVEQVREKMVEPPFKFVAHVCDVQTDTHVVIVKSSDRIILAFRGTVSKKNASTDIDFKLVNHPTAHKVFLSDAESDTSLPRIHRGFLVAYESVQEKVTLIVNYLQAKCNQKLVIMCTGHSLGGSLACLCAFDLATSSYKRGVAVATFGAGKVGNMAFKLRYEVAVPLTHRYVVANDIIPQMPLLDSSNKEYKYYHCGMEILVDLTGNMMINPNFVEHALFMTSRKSLRRHFRGTYGFALMVWIARVHGEGGFTSWKPSWCLPVVDCVTRLYGNDVSDFQPLIRDAIKEQLFVEGATLVIRHIAHQTVSCQTEETSVGDGPDANDVERGNMHLEQLAALFRSAGLPGGDAVRLWPRRNELYQLLRTSDPDLVEADGAGDIQPVTASEVVLEDVSKSDVTDTEEEEEEEQHPEEGETSVTTT